MEYNFREIEQKWQAQWKDTNAYKVSNVSDKPKYYVLDMFPYPSGAGLHVGHPLGYIASDIFARYKRLKGFNVLHPMGYDAFGLPAEQYAIEHGIHPAVSTENNINNFRGQLDKIGFCFDWDREVKTCDPAYYKWTQWIFLQLFNSFFNRQINKAASITSLIKTFEEEGNANHPCPGDVSIVFENDLWKSFTDEYQQEVLMHYRLAYCGYGEVNWCEALGTVLANDEVVNGVSERGGHPVVKKKLRQWYLRITEYADRLLEGLQTVDFSDAMKEMQTNWIGKSTGAEIDFRVRIGKPLETKKVTYKDSITTVVSVSTVVSENGLPLTVYTTRPDTIFGVDFMVIAPEHELIQSITTAEQKKSVDEYLTYVKSKSDRERQAEKKITGCFTGAYAINPFSAKPIPIWISEYVLAGYGTGAIMAVPCGDERDFKFAKHFNIPITNIIGDYFNGEEANATKDAVLTNSDFLNGVVMRDAIEIVAQQLETLGIGKRKVNYKMRDAAFSRQRYWGEPFPIIWRNGVAYPLDENELPLLLPEVDSYSPGPEGEGPLANIKEWSLIPGPSPRVEKGEAKIEAKIEAKGAANVPKYKVNMPLQYEYAKAMRKDYTEAEKLLWELLRDSKLGTKFRRQHPVDAYIVDFISLQNKLVIEVDGGYHETEEQKIYDANRTAVLSEIGFMVVRFTNEEVLANVYAVRDKIKDILAKIDTALTNNETVENMQGAISSLFIHGEGQGVRETNTMPGYAGSSWYFLRYMDPHNDTAFCDRKVSDYWNQVDLYIGGTEHAVGHLLYSRMWTKALYDLGFIGYDEPFKKLLNQGMIQGVSELIYFFQVSYGATNLTPEQWETEKYDYQYFVSYTEGEMEIKLPARRYTIRHVDISLIKDSILNIDEYIKRHPEFAKYRFYCSGGYWQEGSFHKTREGSDKFYTQPFVEKMSKSKFNVVNPDEIVIKYGADTFRMYEMFLGPVEQSKPWDTKGIEGVHRFLKKLWRLFYDDNTPLATQWRGAGGEGEKVSAEELKTLHKTIKKIEDDTERFSFNTAVSAFMVCVNELSDLKCHKKEILEPVIIMLVPYAPHIAEELWKALGNSNSILDAAFPTFEAKYVAESSKEYPVSINGKLRTTINLALDVTQQEVDVVILSNEVVQKWLEGKAPKKIIFVKGKMINVVI